MKPWIKYGLIALAAYVVWSLWVAYAAAQPASTNDGGFGVNF